MTPCDLSDGCPGVAGLASTFITTNPGEVAPSLELEFFR